LLKNSEYTFLDKLITFGYQGAINNRISIFLLKSPKGIRFTEDKENFYEENKNRLSYLNEPIIEEMYRQELKEALESPYLYFHEKIKSGLYVEELMLELGIKSTLSIQKTPRR